MAHQALVLDHIKPILDKILAIDYETGVEVAVPAAPPALSWTLGAAAAGALAAVLVTRALSRN